MIKLIDFEPKHFSILCSWIRSERELVQWGGPDLNYPVTDQQLKHMVAEGQMAPPVRLCWMGLDVNQALAGHIQLALDWKNGVARIGRVMIAPGLRGQGFAAPLVKAAVEQAFSNPQIERTELNVYSWNDAATRTYEKVGFSHEGVRRSSVQVGDERWDTAIMGMLRAEWDLKRGV